MPTFTALTTLAGKEAAEALGLEQPTRFQQFLERMFGPADLWA